MINKESYNKLCKHAENLFKINRNNKFPWHLRYRAIIIAEECLAAAEQYEKDLNGKKKQL